MIYKFDYFLFYKIKQAWLYRGHKERCPFIGSFPLIGLNELNRYFANQKF